LNTLAGRDAAITSEIAGTTRDVIEVRMDLDGLPVTFLDTAGLRQTSDKIEAIGVKRAVDRANSADLRICLVQDTGVEGVEVRDGDLVLSAKSDLTGQTDGVSGLTGEGVPQLIESVKSVLLARSSGAGLISHARQMDIVTGGYEHISAAKEFADKGTDFYELASEELRSGIFALERLVGRVDVEDVLDKVFSSFCIGK
jgi:tRNA modification GTPase